MKPGALKVPWFEKTISKRLSCGAKRGPCEPEKCWYVATTKARVQTIQRFVMLDTPFARGVALHKTKTNAELRGQAKRNPRRILGRTPTLAKSTEHVRVDVLERRQGTVSREKRKSNREKPSHARKDPGDLPGGTNHLGCAPTG